MQVIKVKVLVKSTLGIILVLVISACHPAIFSELYNGYSTKGVHARGMAINDSTLYISGAKGKVTIFNLNALTVVDTFSVPASDLRGIQAISDQKLLLMNSGNDGILYQYHLESNRYDTVLYQPGAFFDAMAVNKSGIGYLMGDPIENQFVFYRTEDFGSTWQLDTSLPIPIEKEAGFAASNTGLGQINGHVYFGTGASDTARLLKFSNAEKKWTVINTPMQSGGSFGIYSINFWSANNGIIAGGSYVEKAKNDSVLFITENGGKTWKNRSSGLPGYISCITSNENASLLVVTGRLGAYYSLNKGKDWQMLTVQPFYTAKITGTLICLSGQNGTLAIFQVQQ